MLLDQLQMYLHTRKMLLLLDNFEQVIDAAPDIATLLAGTLHTVIIVTSHMPLQLAEEMVFGISSFGCSGSTASCTIYAQPSSGCWSTTTASASSRSAARCENTGVTAICGRAAL